MSELKEVKAKLLDALEFMTDEMIRELASRVDASTYKKVEALAHSFEMLDSCDPIWKKKVQYDRPNQQGRNQMIEAKPTIWHGKLMCNDCPRLNTCDAVVEWFDPDYSMATYIEGAGFDIRYGTKDNKCPYQKGEEDGM